MVYAQFFDYSTGYIPGSIPPQFDRNKRELIYATGDRSVVIIDARLSYADQAIIAANECKRRGYPAWQLFKGERFSNSHAITPINQM